MYTKASNEIKMSNLFSPSKIYLVNNCTAFLLSSVSELTKIILVVFIGHIKFYHFDNPTTIRLQDLLLQINDGKINFSCIKLVMLTRHVKFLVKPQQTSD